MIFKKSLVENLLHLKIRCSGFESRNHFVRGSKYHYYMKPGQPNKPTLVLIHGISASAGHFHEVMNTLSGAGYSVIVPDLPGHGMSEELAQTMTVASIKSEFNEYLSQITPNRFVLVGNSLGGALSMHFASEYPGRIIGLILASPGMGFVSEVEWEALRAFLKVKTLDQAKFFLSRLYFKKPFYIGLLAKIVIRNFNRKGVRELVEHTAFCDLQPPAEQTLFRGKTLLIWGQEDFFLPRSNIEGTRKLVAPSTTWEEPPQIGHCPQLDAPEWFARRIAQFAQESL